MAVTVDVFQIKEGGAINYAIKVSETSINNTAEYEITGLPFNGRIVSFLSVLIPGSATTIQPVIGTAPGFNLNSLQHIASQSAAAAYINDATTAPYSLVSDGKLYIRSMPNSGVLDNRVDTNILIVEGGG